MTEPCPRCDHPQRLSRAYSDALSWVYSCARCGNTWTTTRDDSRHPGDPT